MARFTKKGVALLVGTVALAASAGFAQAQSTRFAVQDSGGTVDKMAVTDQGNIGVRVTDPNGPAAGLYVKGALYPDNTIKVEGPGGSGGGGGYIGYGVPTDGTWPKANDRLGYFLFGSINAGTAIHASGVTTSADGDWSSTSNPTNFAFVTTPPGSTGGGRQERMRITGWGNVGIGVQAPTAKLEVAGGVRLNTAATKPACSATQRGTIWLTQGTTGADELDVCMRIDATNFAWVKVNP